MFVLRFVHYTLFLYECVCVYPACLYVSVCVSAHLEEGVYVLLRDVPLQGGVSVLPHHVVDGLHDVQHLLQKEQRKPCHSIQRNPTIKSDSPWNLNCNTFACACGGVCVCVYKRV